MKLKFIVLSAIFLLFIPSCLTTAVLKQKTIILNKSNPMTRAGINWGYPHRGREEFEIYNELGISWLRTDFFWNKLEKEPGVWTFEETDFFCEQAKDKGFNILGVLAYDTPWIHEDPKKKREVNPDQLPHYLNYVRTVVERYGDYVTEWEIWNEPNLPFNTFWTGSDKDFFELTRATAALIREIDPDAKIMAGSHWRFSKSYIKDMHQSGALENVDIFSYHPYYDKPLKVYEKSRELEDYLKLSGFKGEFRITEVGYSTYGKLPTSCKPEEQGRRVMETLVLLGKFKHPYLIWYSLYGYKNSTPTGIWSDQYGILLKDGDTFEYKTGGWAFRRYNELIADTYPSHEVVFVDDKLSKKIIYSLYWNGTNRSEQTLLLMGEKKELELILDGYESGTLYNCATGESVLVQAPLQFTLKENDPLIFVLNNINNLSVIER